MSFGFAVGDFIAVADRALLIYRKCKSAPEDIECLARHVQILADVLVETKAFLTVEKPLPSIKRDALISARDACTTTLNEVEAFLAQYEDIRTKGTRRYIQLAKFITKDVEGLKAKLGNSTALLQLSLSFLSSLSIARVEKALHDIQTEYQSGLHPPTVLSNLRDDKGRTDREELFQQLLIDLEDKDVHPDSIDLHQSFISTWLSNVVISDGLEERPRAMEDGDRQSPPKQIPGASHSSERENVSTTANAFTDEIRNSIASKVSHSEHATQHTFPTPSSTKSSCSVEDEIPLPAELDTIFAILTPLFESDPDVPTDSVELSHRIDQSFIQYDWSHRGFLTRKEVANLYEYIILHIRWGRVLLETEITPLKDQIWTLVCRGDDDRNGQLDKKKFTKITTEFAEDMIRVRHNWIKEQIDQSLDHYVINPRPGLPWTWPKHLGRPPPLKQIALGVQPAKSWMCPMSFTELVREAELALDAIGITERQNTSAAMGPFRQQVSQSLSRVRRVALAFTLFEHRDNPLYISDLDAFIILVGTDSPDARKEGALSGPLGALEEALWAGFRISCHIRAFLMLLWNDKPVTSTLNIKGDSEPSSLMSQEQWKSHFMEYRSRRISRKMHNWNKIISQVAEVRSIPYRLHRLEALDMPTIVAPRQEDRPNPSYQPHKALLKRVQVKQAYPLIIANRKVRYRVQIETDGLLQEWTSSKMKFTPGESFGMETTPPVPPVSVQPKYANPARWRISNNSRMVISILGPTNKEALSLQSSYPRTLQDAKKSVHAAMHASRLITSAVAVNRPTNQGSDVSKSMDDSFKCSFKIVPGGLQVRNAFGDLYFTDLQQSTTLTLSVKPEETSADWTTGLVNLFEEMGLKEKSVKDGPQSPSS